MTALTIDDTDRELIRILQSDGRTTYSKLGQMVGLSDAATRQRVNRLVADGVIDIVAVTDPAKLGIQFQALLGVTVTGSVNETADAIGAFDEAVYVVMTAGRYDAIVEIVSRSVDDFITVSNAIRAIDGVRTVETMTYLDITKQTYDWGVG